MSNEAGFGLEPWRPLPAPQLHPGSIAGAQRRETTAGEGAHQDADPPPRPLPPPPPLRAHETDLTGELRPTERGPIWVARGRYAPDFQHGRLHIGRAHAWDRAGLGLATREARAVELPPERWVFVDLETTGLGIDAGTYAFLVGLGWLEAESFVVEQFLLRDPSEEPALLLAVAARLAPFDGVISFNGKSFDLPLLTTRFLMCRQAALHQELAHCDLLHAARRIWTHRTADRRLATLERQMLGVRRHGDVPGALIPQRYATYLRQGDAELLDPVLAHNRLDLLSMLMLTREIASFVGRAREGAGGARLYELELLAEDRLRAAHLLLEGDDRAAAAQFLQACLAGFPSNSTRLAALRSLAALRKRQGDVAAACGYWKEMLVQVADDLEPYEELAKAAEHRRGDAQAALDWVQRGLAQAHLDACDRSALEHRRRRLQRKLQRVRLWD